jgi:hypothetical protein
MELRKDRKKRFQRRTKVQHHSQIRKEQPFQRHSLGQRRNPIHKAQPFRLRTKDR